MNRAMVFVMATLAAAGVANIQAAAKQQRPAQVRASQKPDGTYTANADIGGFEVTSYVKHGDDVRGTLFNGLRNICYAGTLTGNEIKLRTLVRLELDTKVRPPAQRAVDLLPEHSKFNLTTPPMKGAFHQLALDVCIQYLGSAPRGATTDADMPSDSVLEQLRRFGAVSRRPHFSEYEETVVRQIINALIRRLTGQPWGVVLELTGDTPISERAAHQFSKEQIAAAQREFDAEAAAFTEALDTAWGREQQAWTDDIPYQPWEPKDLAGAPMQALHKERERRMNKWMERRNEETRYQAKVQREIDEIVEW
jgi:hypothetical protein